MRYLAILCLLAACGKEAPPGPEGDEKDHAAHGHAPRMGGQLLDLDHIVQIEFVHDPSAGALKAYLWDGHVSTAVRTEQEVIRLRLSPGPGVEHDIRLEAVANKLTGETVGDSATFEAVSPWLRHTGRLKATLVKLDAMGQTWERVEFVLCKDEK